MPEKSFYALEYRELNALRQQSEQDGSALCFRITENGLIPANGDGDYDLAIGRSAIYLYAPSLPVRKLRHRRPSAPAAEGTMRDRLENEVFRLLFQIEEFEPLNDAELWKLSEQAIRWVYPAGYVIVRQDDEGDSLFVLAEGLLQVSMRIPDGQTLAIRKLAPGHCFGEMSLLTGAPRSANVEAETECVVYEIRKEHLLSVMEKNQRIVQVLSELMAERELASGQKASLLTAETADDRSLALSFSRKMLEFFGLGETRENG
jgi:CRP-like cAMP-binding protein